MVYLQGALSVARASVGCGMVTRAIHRARKLGRAVADPSYRGALLMGVVAASEHDSDPLPADLRTIVDVGANRGQFALVAARRWPSAVLICLEPLGKPRKTLRRALRRHSRLKVIDAAASDASGTAVLHVSRSDDSSSLRAITDRQTLLFPGTEEVGTVPVRTVRLDEVIAIRVHERPALLKIDVQGGELDALHGATGLLPTIDFVLVESSFTELYAGQALADDVIRFLQSQGFALSAVLAPTVGRDGVVVQADLLFTQVRTDGA
jgi:FkbM family methyltransferase